MTEQPEQVPEPDAQVLDAAEVPEAARKLRSEARSLRQRLHAAEDEIAKRDAEIAKRDTDIERLVTQAAARQRADIEAAAAEVLVDPQDVWRVDPERQQQFYDEQFGEISRDSIMAAAKELAASKPHLARPNATPPPSAQPIEGLRPGASPEVKPKATSWSAALRGTGI
jgi:hypothetical protein